MPEYPRQTRFQSSKNLLPMGVYRIIKPLEDSKLKVFFSSFCHHIDFVKHISRSSPGFVLPASPVIPSHPGQADKNSSLPKMNSCHIIIQTVIPSPSIISSCDLLSDAQKTSPAIWPYHVNSCLKNRYPDHTHETYRILLPVSRILSPINHPVLPAVSRFRRRSS